MEDCRHSSLLWIKNELENDMIMVSQYDTSGYTSILNFNFNCIHILKLFIKLQPTFRCAIRVNESFSESDTKDVTEVVLFIDTGIFKHDMKNNAQLRCEEQFYSLMNMFKTNCRFNFAQKIFPDIIFENIPLGMRKAISWMHGIGQMEYIEYTYNVPIADTGWFYDHENMTFSQIQNKPIILKPRGYIMNTPSSTEKMKGICLYLDTLCTSYSSPIICQKSWLIHSNTSLIICADETFDTWNTFLSNKKSISVRCLSDLKALTMHDITSNDALLITHDFLNSFNYIEWLSSNIEVCHQLTSSAVRTFIRKMFYKRVSLSHIMPVIQGVRWNRVFIEDFNTFDCKFMKNVHSKCTFGLSDMVDAISMDQIHNIVMPTYASNTDILSRCIFKEWIESNVCEQELIPIHTKSLNIPTGNTYNVGTWIHENVTLFSWFNYVPAWQRRKLLQALTVTQTREYSIEQISRYAKKNEMCPICFGMSNCMTSCGHHFCDSCLLNVSPIPPSQRVSYNQRIRQIKKQCPTCRADFCKVFTNSSNIDTRLEKVIEKCKYAMRNSKRVLVFSQWDEIFYPLKIGLKRRRLELDPSIIKFVRLCEHALPKIVDGDITIFAHVPIFSSNLFLYHFMNRIRNTCKHVDILYSKDTPEEELLHKIFSVNGNKWTIPRLQEI